ncbi:TPA: gp16 family protein [Salmonella enterica subsp. enterica serovar Aberdeen]
MDRASLITLIHVAKKDLHLDADTYRDALRAAVGKTSCRDMTQTELSKVLATFKKRGFKVRSRPQNRALKPATVTAKIRAIWRLMYAQGFLSSDSEAALNGWVRKQTAPQNGGEGVANYQWLEKEPALASDMLERLKRWHRREMLRALGLSEREKISYDQTCQRYRSKTPASR